MNEQTCNTPKIRFPGYNDPWEQRKLVEYASFSRGTGLSWSDISEDGQHECILYGNLYTDYGMIATEIKYRTSTILTNPVLSKCGDVLIPGSDTTPTGLARATSIEKTGVLLGGDINILRPNEGVSGSCLSLAINANKKELIKLIKGTTVRHIHNEDIKGVEVSLPKSSTEQEKIVQFFKQLEKTITLHQCKLDQIKEYKKSMLQKMFPKKGTNVPEVRFPGFNYPWEQRKLNEYLEVSKAKNKDERFGKEDVLSVSGDYGIVNQIEFQGRSFAGVSVAPYGVVETGDVVYTKSPLKSNPYGIIKTNKGKPGIVSTLYAIYKPLEKTCSEFVQIYFEQDARMNNYMHPLANKGAKNDMKVSAENALKGDVIFPSKEEQIRISEYFAKLDTLITLHQRKLDQMKDYKQGLLQQMFI